jgi:hypothetical protein
MIAFPVGLELDSAFKTPPSTADCSLLWEMKPADTCGSLTWSNVVAFELCPLYRRTSKRYRLARCTSVVGDQKDMHRRPRGPWSEIHSCNPRLGNQKRIKHGG